MEWGKAAMLVMINKELSKYASMDVGQKGDVRNLQLPGN